MAVRLLLLPLLMATGSLDSSTPRRLSSWPRCQGGATFHPQLKIEKRNLARYEYEKQRHEHLSEKELEDALTTRGSDYATIRYHHNIHKVCTGKPWKGTSSNFFLNNPTCCSMQTLELEVARELEAAGVETRTVKRTEYNDDVVR